MIQICKNDGDIFKDDTLELSTVIEEIRIFLEPVFDAIINEEEWLEPWISQNNMWITLNER